jgi:DNA polymerase-3 subunit chi
MFDGNDYEAVTSARARWKTYKAAGHDLTYWQQTDRGGWEKKA